MGCYMLANRQIERCQDICHIIACEKNGLSPAGCYEWWIMATVWNIETQKIIGWSRPAVEIFLKIKLPRMDRDAERLTGSARYRVLRALETLWNYRCPMLLERTGQVTHLFACKERFIRIETIRRFSFTATHHRILFFQSKTTYSHPTGRYFTAPHTHRNLLFWTTIRFVDVSHIRRPVFSSLWEFERPAWWVAFLERRSFFVVVSMNCLKAEKDEISSHHFESCKLGLQVWDTIAHEPVSAHSLVEQRLY